MLIEKKTIEPRVLTEQDKAAYQSMRLEDAEVSELIELVNRGGHPGMRVCVASADVGRLMEVYGSDDADNALANSNVKIVYPKKP